MIKSMTAFARKSVTTGQGVLTVELRSVNHRYLDCSFTLPDTLRSLEPQLRDRLGAKLSRGKLDCSFRMQAHPAQLGELDIDAARLAAVLAAAASVQERMTAQHSLVATSISPLDVLQFPGVCGVGAISEEQLHKDALALFNEALDSMQQSRAREGDKLAVQTATNQARPASAARNPMMPMSPRGGRR